MPGIGSRAVVVPRGVVRIAAAGVIGTVVAVVLGVGGVRQEE